MTKILGMVLRTGHYEEQKDLYRFLGINVDEHQHGGPLHLGIGSLSKDFVVEVYKSSAKFSVPSLMVDLERDLMGILGGLKEEFNIVPEDRMKEFDSGRKFVYIKDFDGQLIMLIGL